MYIRRKIHAILPVLKRCGLGDVTHGNDNAVTPSQRNSRKSFVNSRTCPESMRVLYLDSGSTDIARFQVDVRVRFHQIAHAKYLYAMLPANTMNAPPAEKKNQCRPHARFPSHEGAACKCDNRASASWRSARNSQTSDLLIVPMRPLWRPSDRTLSGLSYSAAAAAAAWSGARPRSPTKRYNV